MGALLAWAVHWRWLGGLVAGVGITASDLAIREHVTQANYGNAFLLLIGGPIVGFMAESLQRMAAERDRAQREPRPRPSGPGWRGPSTTACCRCSPWCSAAGRAGG